jgi:hypothetical protein
LKSALGKLPRQRLPEKVIGCARMLFLPAGRLKEQGILLDFDFVET